MFYALHVVDVLAVEADDFEDLPQSANWVLTYR
jgi:hypothetical protein